MARNQYDSDVTVWSPQGRLYQLEYATEAVTLGSATVALKNKTLALLVGLKRSSELSYHQKKILAVDKHIGVSLAGLTADARILAKFLRTESTNYRYMYGESIPISRIMIDLGKKIQTSTQRYDKRPYGVGLLIAGYDSEGPHIYEARPNNVMCCHAMALGSRSQSAKTYLEKNMDSIVGCTKDDLIKQGLRALRETMPAEQDLSIKNVAIAIVGKDVPFKEFTSDETEDYLKVILREERRALSVTSNANLRDSRSSSQNRKSSTSSKDVEKGKDKGS